MKSYIARYLQQHTLGLEPSEMHDNRDCVNCAYYGSSADCSAERTFDGSDGRKLTVKEPSGRTHTVLRFDLELTETDVGYICDCYETKKESI